MCCFFLFKDKLVYIRFCFIARNKSRWRNAPISFPTDHTPEFKQVEKIILLLLNDILIRFYRNNSKPTAITFLNELRHSLPFRYNEAESIPATLARSL